MNEVLAENIEAMYRKQVRMALKCGGRGPKRYRMLEEFCKGQWKGMKQILLEHGYEADVERIDAEEAERAQQGRGISGFTRRMMIPGSRVTGA